MQQKVQQAVLILAQQAEKISGIRTLRRFVVGTASAFRNTAAGIRQIKGIAETAARHEAEVGSWVSPEALADRQGGPFDACDIRHWLALADLAKVPAVPARTILTLTQEEMSVLSGNVALPDTASVRRMRAGLAAAAQELSAEIGEETTSSNNESSINLEALQERLFDAMDDVPEGWMVRSNRCGGTELKSLAGFGVIGDQVPEVRFGPNVEVGPGWVRIGNRRQVNVSDNRTVQAAAQGPGFTAFLARPWQQCSRYLVGEDPHRHGTPFAGKGVWPAEWRAFVQDGVVIGVASYYGWSDSATPETARTALEVRARAQAIVDEAVRQRAFPRYPDIELVRGAEWIENDPTLKAAFDGPFGRDTVSCTIDFIETDQGPMFLEAGPAVSPVGGGHPVAFAGVVKGQLGVVPEFAGVAFRVMDHVILADPATWQDGDRTGCILDWPAVEQLAASE